MPSPRAMQQLRERLPVVEYLFYDDWTNPGVSGVRRANRGAWNVTDSGSKLSLSGGDLAVSSTTGNSDPKLVGTDGFSRAAGLAMLCDVVVSATTIGGAPGFANGAGGTSLTHRVAPRPSLPVSCYETSGSPVNVPDQFSAGARVSTGIIVRSAGAFYLAYASGGTPTLIWVAASDVNGNLFPCWNALTAGSNPKLGPVRVVDLSKLDARWASDYGIATQRLAGARADGDAFSHTADCLIEHTIDTLPASGTVDLEFRRQDASNLWKVSIGSTGAINLYERVSGTDTSRANGTGVTAGSRIMIIAAGNTIAMFAGSTQKGSTYSSASNFNTRTSGRLALPSGAASNVVAWPRTVTLPTLPAPRVAYP